MTDSITDTDKLIREATVQLNEHKLWLAAQILEFRPTDHYALVEQVEAIKLTMARSTSGIVTVVYAYPDELGAFLLAETTPKELRESITSGHIVDATKPAFTVVRGPDGV